MKLVTVNVLVECEKPVTKRHFSSVVMTLSITHSYNYYYSHTNMIVSNMAGTTAYTHVKKSVFY